MKHSNRSRAVLKPRTPGLVESLTIGIDLGDRRSHICVLDGAGETVREEDISTGPHSFEAYFKIMHRAVVALEVGMHSRWASRVLHECSHDVIVANPAKVKLISSNDRKNDRVDARSLARLARVDRRIARFRRCSLRGIGNAGPFLWSERNWPSRRLRNLCATSAEQVPYRNPSRSRNPM